MNTTVALPPTRSLPRTLLGGVPIQAATRAEFRTAILADIAAIMRTPALERSGGAQLVATINLDFLCNTYWPPQNFRRRRRYLRSLQTAAYATADGMPLVWLARARGLAVPERVSGADLTLDLLRGLPPEHSRATILCGDAESYLAATERLASIAPGLKCRGEFPRVDADGRLLDADSGAQFSLGRTRDFFERIPAHRPALLLLGLSSPKQELIFRRYRRYIRAPIAVGMGGTVNFIAGRVRRAPEWLGRLGLEWLFRLAMEPARLWQRYFKNAVCLGLFTLTLLPLHRFARVDGTARQRGLWSWLHRQRAPL